MRKFPLNQQQIEQLIPHSGKMCLLQQVDFWDHESICCSTLSHQATDNPLRHNGRLSAIQLLEYGAQAMAIHGGILQQAAVPGYLAAVRDVHLLIDYLDEVNSQLMIHAVAQIKSAQGVIYEFTTTDEEQRPLLNARATIINF